MKYFHLQSYYTSEVVYDHKRTLHLCQYFNEQPSCTVRPRLCQVSHKSVRWGFVVVILNFTHILYCVTFN